MSVFKILSTCKQRFSHFLLIWVHYFIVCLWPFYFIVYLWPWKSPQYKAEWKPREHVPTCTSLEQSTSIQKNTRRMSLSWTCYFLVWFSGSFFPLSRAPSPHFPAQRWWSLSLSLCQFKCLFSTVNTGHSDWEDNVNHLIQWSCIKLRIDDFCLHSY